MTNNTQSLPPHDATYIKDTILEESLDDVMFEGWIWDNIEKTGTALGHDSSFLRYLFPEGLNDVIAHFSDWADRKMLLALDDIAPDHIKIRDRIHMACLKRFEILTPYKEAVRYSMGYWTHPIRGPKAGAAIWHTADAIWIWAGDTATDYNHYTKRALLSAVIASTSLAWLNDEQHDLDKTSAFLQRRIENVLFAGRQIGKIKKFLTFFTCASPSSTPDTHERHSSS